jgi:hypothetical protein
MRQPEVYHARNGDLFRSHGADICEADSCLTFEDAGEHELKGVPGTWHLYRVAD